MHQAYEWIKEQLGEEIILDAAQFGSRAHRVRSFWTNGVPVDQARRVRAQTERPKDTYVQDILDEGRHAKVCSQGDRLPQYPTMKSETSARHGQPCCARLGHMLSDGAGEVPYMTKMELSWVSPR